MFNASQLSDLIIKPVLQDLVMYSEAATQLLLFTCAVESDGGTYLKQIKGPALGIYQMEPRTYNDIWQNYLKNKNRILLMLISNFGIVNMPSEDTMIHDLRFATAMARLHYYRVPEKLPAYNDIEGIWRYYKIYYNSLAGASRREQSIAKYHNFMRD